MLTVTQAFQIARKEGSEGVAVYTEDARELKNGWFFPWRTADGDGIVGSHGVIVNKGSGAVFTLGSAFSLERDLRAYQDGFEHEVYDFKVVRVHDEDRTLSFLLELDITTVEPEVADGTVWRIPRRLSREELGGLLLDLPHTFRDVSIYFRVEAIRDAREEGYCDFELIEQSE